MILRSWVALLIVVACGGAAPPPAVPPATSTVVPPAVAPDVAPVGVSVVRFDDLGVSFAVPPGFHVLGDDELAARIRASANPRLASALQSRATQKKGVPLVTLSRQTEGTTGELNVGLTATVVPKDTTAMELLTHQLAAMKESVDSVEWSASPNPISKDGVAGVELSGSYVLHGGKKVATVIRLYVRGELAFTNTAVWPAPAPDERATEARALLDGVKFYEPLAQAP